MPEERTVPITGNPTDSLIALGRRTTTLLKRWYQEVADMSACGELPQAQLTLGYACVLACTALGHSGASTPELREAVRENRLVAAFRDAEPDPPRAHMRAGVDDLDQLTWRVCEHALAADCEALTQTLLPVLAHPGPQIHLHAVRLGWMARAVLCRSPHLHMVSTLLDRAARQPSESKEGLALAAQWFGFDQQFLFYGLLHPVPVQFSQRYSALLVDLWGTRSTPGAIR